MDNDIYKKLQEMLPDFVFGRLQDSDKEFFELNYKNYPDLVKEVDEIKSVFNRFDKMDFDNLLTNKTRNISVKIIEKREKYKKYNKIGSFSYLIRYALPVAIIITFLIYLVEKNNKQDIIGSNNNFNDNSISSQLENDTLDFVLQGVEYLDLDQDNLILTEENLLSEYIENEMIEIENINYENMLFLSDINNLSDDEVIYLIEEMQK
jgi:hypothetical protein